MKLKEMYLDAGKRPLAPIKSTFELRPAEKFTSTDFFDAESNDFEFPRRPYEGNRAEWDPTAAFDMASNDQLHHPNASETQDDCVLQGDSPHAQADNEKAAIESMRFYDDNSDHKQHPTSGHEDCVTGHVNIVPAPFPSRP